MMPASRLSDMASTALRGYAALLLLTLSFSLNAGPRLHPPNVSGQLCSRLR